MNARIIATTALIAVALGALGAASGPAHQDPLVACDQAIAQAMAIDPNTDTLGAVDGTTAGCASIEAWVVGANRHTDTFDEQNPAGDVDLDCDVSPDNADAAVCDGLESA